MIKCQLKTRKKKKYLQCEPYWFWALSFAAFLLCFYWNVLLEKAGCEFLFLLRTRQYAWMKWPEHFGLSDCCYFTVESQSKHVSSLKWPWCDRPVDASYKTLCLQRLSSGWTMCYLCVTGHVEREQNTLVPGHLPHLVEEFMVFSTRTDACQTWKPSHYLQSSWEIVHIP